MNFRIEPAGSAGQIERKPNEARNKPVGKMSKCFVLAAAATLLLVPLNAFAQKTPPKAAAAPAGQELDLDQPEAAKPAGAEPSGPAGGICEIDPSACPKVQDLGEAARRKVKADIYAVEQIYALRYHRFELQPYWSFTLNDQFVSHPGPGLAMNYYLTNVLAIGLNGNFYSGLNVDSDFNFQNRRQTPVAVPLTEYP